jgi:lipid-binding SYLF domain-containing protein
MAFILDMKYSLFSFAYYNISIVFRLLIWSINFSKFNPKALNKENDMNKFITYIFCLTAFLTSNLTFAGFSSDLIPQAKETISMFKKNDKSIQSFFDKSAGFAVFSNVGKGGLGIGGMNGDGVVFEKENPIGYAELTAITIGFQAGGQAFREIVFFQSKNDLENFKNGNIKFSAQVSAVAVTAGAAAKTNFQNGLAVFTMAKGGLMYEASVGGQKFSFEPLKKK